MKQIRFLQLTSEELANVNELKTTETTEKIHHSMNAIPRLPPLLPDYKSFIDLFDEKSEIELNTIDMSGSDEKHFEVTTFVRNEQLLTQETLLGIFYKFYKPMIVLK